MLFFPSPVIKSINQPSAFFVLNLSLHVIYLFITLNLTCILYRGARPSIKDGGGLSSLERAMEMGAITDEELFILLAES